MADDFRISAPSVEQEIHLHVDGQDKIRELTGQLQQAESELDKMSAILENTQDELRETREEYDRFANSSGLDILKKELERFRETTSNAAEEFRAFLQSVNLNDSFGSNDWKFDELFEKIRSGCMTVSQAITQVKTEYGHLIYENYSSNGGIFDSQMVQSFTASLERLGVVVADISGRLANIEQNGVSSSGGGGNLSNVMQQIEAAAAGMSDEARAAYEPITNLVRAMTDYANLDDTKLLGVSQAFRNIADIGSGSYGTKSIENIVYLAKQLQALSANGLGSVRFDFTGLNDLKIRKASLHNLATYLPELAKVSVEKLQALSNVNLTNFNDIKVSKSSIEAIAQLAEALGLLQTKTSNTSTTTVGAFAGEEAGVKGVTDTLKEHSVAMQGAREAERAKAQQSEELAADLEAEKSALEDVNHAADEENAAESNLLKRIADAAKAGRELLRSNSEATRASGETSESFERTTKYTELFEKILDRTGGSAVRLRTVLTDMNEEIREVGVDIETVLTRSSTAISTMNQELTVTDLRGSASLSTLENTAKQAQQLLTKNAGMSHLQSYQELSAQLEHFLNDIDGIRNGTRAITGSFDTLGISATHAVENIRASMSALNLEISRVSDMSGSGGRDMFNKVADQYKKMLDAINGRQDLSHTSEFSNLNNRLESLKKILNECGWDATKFWESVGGNGKQVVDAINEAITALKIFNAKAAETPKPKSSPGSTAEDDLIRLTNLYAQMQNTIGNGGIINETSQYTEMQEIIVKLRSVIAECNGDATKLGEALKHAGLDGSTVFKDAAMIMAQFRATLSDAQVKQGSADALKSYDKAVKDYSKTIRECSAAEHSRHESSREAYADLTKSKEAMDNAVEALRSYKGDQDGLRRKTEEAVAAIQNYNRTSRESVQTIRENGDAAKSLSQRFADLAQRFSVWFSATQMIMFAVRSIRKMIRESMELDTVMTQMQVVTKASAKEMEEFGKKAVESASRVGASVKDIVTASTTYARLGYNAEDSAKLAEYTTMLQSVGDIEAGDAQNAVTAIIKAFDIDVDQIESVMDKLVAVGNHFPISVSQIAEGMNNASSTLHAAGNSFDQSVALLTAANTTVQNAAKAATGLRTIAARLRKTKTELDALGESMTDAQYEEIISALTKYGVTLKNTNGEFRSTYDILADLAKVWKTLGSEEQAALATTIANTRQQDIFYSVIESFQEASGAMDTMSGSAGELNQAFSKYLDSIKAHVEKFKTAFTELSNSTFTRDFLNGFIDLGKTLIDVLGLISKLINLLGGLKGALYIISGIAITAKIEKVRSILKSVLLFLPNLISNAIKLGSAYKWANKEMRAIPIESLRYGLKQINVELSRTQLVVGGIIAIIGAALLAVHHIKQIIDSAREKADEAAEKASEEAKSISELTQKYKELASSGDFDNSAREEVKNIQSQITDLVGDQAKNLDLVNGKLDEELKKLRNISYEQAKDSQDTFETKYKDAKGQYDRATRARGIADDSILGIISSDKMRYQTYLSQVMENHSKKFTDLAARLGATYNNLLTGKSEVIPLGQLISPNSTLNAEQLLEVFKELRSTLLHEKGALDWTWGEQDILNDLQAKIDTLTGIVDTYQQASKDYWNSKATVDVGDFLAANDIDTLEEYNNVIDDIKQGTFNAKTVSGEYGEVLIEFFENLFPQFSGKAKDVENALSGVAEQTKSLEKQMEKLAGLQKSISALSSAYSDMVGDDGAVSFKSLSSIAEQFKDVDGIDNYIARIATLRNDASGLSDVLNELLTDFVEQKLAAGELADTDEDVIEAMLREAGVANADQAAHALLADAKEKVAAKAVIEKDGLQNVIDKLGEEASYAEVSRSALIRLAAQMVQTNDKKMTFSEQISALESLAKAAGVTGAIVASSSKMMSFLAEKHISIGADGKVDPRALSYLATQKQLTESEWNDLKNFDPTKLIDDYVKTISDAVSSVKFDFDFSGSKKKKDGTEKSKKEIEEYLATIDNFRDAQKALDEATSSREAIEAQLERNHSLDEELTLRGKLADAYVAEQKALHNLNNVRDKEIRTTQIALDRLGFEVSYDDKLNKFDVLNPDNINQLNPVVSEENLKKLKALVKKYNSITNGNVDYGKRPFIRGKKMRDAGWDDFENGDIATTYSQGFTIGEGKRLFTIEVTPILENGEVLSPDAIKDYVNSLDTSGDMRRLLASDTSKLIMNARHGGYDEKYWKQWEEKFAGIKNEHLDIARSSGLIDLLVSGSLTDALLSADDPQEAANNYRKAVEELIKSAETWNESNGTGSEEWWKLQEQNIQNSIDALSAVTKYYENKISLTENWLNSAIENRDYTKVQEYTDNIASYYKTMQEKIHDQAQYYRALGYGNESDEVSQLSNLWWEYEQKRVSVTIDAWDRIVQASHESVDKIQDVYSTLQDAADEYAANGGFISIDTFQSIVQLGAQYMRYLSDENGMLVINREHINKVLAAKTQDLAIEEALAYVEKLRIATQSGNVKELDKLLYATVDATNATWGLVYANLALIDLDDKRAEAALQNIDALRSLADGAVTGIGRVTGEAADQLEKMQSGLDDIMRYVMDMLKQSIDEQIQALEDMKDSYSDIIKMKKESLKTTKEETNYQKSLSSKMKEVAKLQAKIDAISFAADQGDRKAQAERISLQEELTRIQEDLADTQSDHAVSAQEDALDKMEKAYHDEKDREINDLKDSISSQQKLYKKAIEYIDSFTIDQWGTMLNQLKDWNYQYGSELEDNLVSAWENGLEAMKRYHSFEDAQLGVKTDIESVSNSGSNNALGTYNEYNDGSSQEASIRGIVSQMKANSKAWSTSTNRKLLEDENKRLAEKLVDYGLFVVMDDNYRWRIGSTSGDLLYEKFHTGGIVGNSTKKQDEEFALLKNKEWVLSEQMVNNLVAQMERLKVFRTTFDNLSLYPGKDGISHVLQSIGAGALNKIMNSASQPIKIEFGDTIINGANGDTVKQHVEITRDMVNQIARMLKKTM